MATQRIGPGLSVLEPADVELSTTTKAYRGAADAREALLRGCVLAVDPSSGSVSSMPGWCLWEGGVPSEWGTIALPAGAPIWVRLTALRRAIEDLAAEWSPDALVVEDVPLMRFGKGGRGSVGRQLPLLYACAVVMAAAATPLVVEVRPRQWRAFLPDGGAGYRKQDDHDAVMLAYAAWAMASHAEARVRKRTERATRAATKRAEKTQIARPSRASRLNKETA